MKKAILPILFLLLLAFVGYEHRDKLDINTNFILEDQAEYVLNANIPDNEIIDTFYNETYDPIYMPVGIEETYGFRHILARHSINYFVNFSNKNEISLFPDKITGSDLINSLIGFYEHCVDVPLYNRQRARNIVYIGFAKIKDERLKCLLIVRQENRQVVSFYPFDEKNIRDVINYD